jgi:hypothetical protein
MFLLINSHGKAPMIIETQDVVVMNEDEDLAATLMGGIWTDFKASIPEPQAKILTEGFNLILLSNPSESDQEDLSDPDFNSGRQDTLLPNVITGLLVDENTHTPEKKNAVFQLITGNIIETLVKLGFTLNEDEVNPDRLTQLNQLVSLFYDLNNYQDLIGLADVLDSADIPPKDRYLMVMQKYLGENFDIDVYELMVDDVSEVTLKAIRDSLMQEDMTEMPAQSIIKRIVQNKAELDGTLVYTHIRNNGQVGGSVQSFLNFYRRELDALTDEPTPENLFKYGKEVIAIFLASELNTPVIKDRLMRFLADVVTDYQALIQIENLINRLVLTDE